MCLPLYVKQADEEGAKFVEFGSLPNVTCRTTYSRPSSAISMAATSAFALFTLS